MSATAEADEKDYVSRLFLDQLGRLGRGERAVLKRNAGRTIAESRGATGLFYRILPEVPPAQEEIYFLVATLYGINGRGHTGNLGATMRDVRQARDRKYRGGARSGNGAGWPNDRPDPTDRRMAILLDADFDLIEGRLPGGGEMAYRVWQAVKLAEGAKVGVNWMALLQDLLWWSHPDRQVRKRWARAYFQNPTEDEQAAKPEEGDVHHVD